MNRILFGLIMFAAFPVLAATDLDPRVEVAEGVSVSVVQQDLTTRRPVYLAKLKTAPEKREEYVRWLYFSNKLEKAMEERELDNSQEVLEALRNARKKIFIDALVKDGLKQVNNDILALARDRYQADRDKYKTRKKVKLAIIFLAKDKGEEEQAKKKIQEIMEQLKKEPDNHELFSELAKQYSDDKHAAQGGLYKKWLMAPTDLNGSTPIIQAAFALETVGQLSDIIENSQGYNIIKLMAVTPSISIKFESVKERLMKEIGGDLWGIKKAEIEKSLRAKDDLVINDKLVEQLIVEERKKR